MSNQKKLSRHQWVFETHDQQMLLNMARIGLSTKEIMRVTGYTSSQVSYALHKAKVCAEMDQGFRVRWRCGNDPLVDRVLRDYAAIMVREIKRDVCPKIVHPTPETVKVKE
jgi:hypothetical protein